MFVNNGELKRSVSDNRKKLSRDMQMHLAPDIVQRSSNETLFEKGAREAQYFGWSSKCHYLTTDGTQLIIPPSQDVPRFFGSVALNNSMGGLDAYTAEVAVKTGASEIRMPTLLLNIQSGYFSGGKSRVIKQIRCFREPID